MKTRISLVEIHLFCLRVRAHRDGKPSVMVLPGGGRSFDAPRADEASCRRYALNRTGGTRHSSAAVRPPPPVRPSAPRSVPLAQPSVAKQGAVVGAGSGHHGSAVGIDNAAGGYGTQRQYDNALRPVHVCRSRASGASAGRYGQRLRCNHRRKGHHTHPAAIRRRHRRICGAESDSRCAETGQQQMGAVALHCSSCKRLDAARFTARQGLRTGRDSGACPCPMRRRSTADRPT